MKRAAPFLSIFGLSFLLGVPTAAFAQTTAPLPEPASIAVWGVLAAAGGAVYLIRQGFKK
jgi:hypothetical protein